MTISVSAELEAMALPQPKVWNLASAIRSSSSLKVQPQRVAAGQGADLADAVGVSISPTLRGFRKWSLTLSV